MEDSTRVGFAVGTGVARSARTGTRVAVGAGALVFVGLGCTGALVEVGCAGRLVEVG
jgi:hypothetical protein